MSKSNGKTAPNPLTTNTIIKLWDGRLYIEFLPASVLQRASAWRVINEIEANYGDQTELAIVDVQLASFAMVYSSLAVLQIEKQDDDNEYLSAFIDWCHELTLKPVTELFRELVHMPPEFYDTLVNAYNSRPSYIPIAQAPIDKIPEALREEALDPKAG